MPGTHPGHSWAVEREEVFGKFPEIEPEDVIVTGTGLCAVIDGATDKHGLSWTLDGSPITSGLFAAMVLAEELRSIPAGTVPQEAVARLSARLSEAIEAQHPGLAVSQRPCASAVVADPAARIIWAVGDCQAAWTLSDGSVEEMTSGFPTDEVAANMRAAVLAALEASGNPWEGTDPDPGWEAILPLLRLQGAFANAGGEWGYAVLDGSTVKPEGIVVRDISRADRIVLASDGYPDLAVDGLLDFDAAEAHLAALLAADPFCVGPLRSTKGLRKGAASFDDRSWLELRLIP